MNENAKVTMMLCQGLEQAEQEKVDRLDGPISTKFHREKKVVRICQGSGSGAQRVLDFCGPTGIVGRILASDFLAASDNDAVGGIELL